ncbi:Nif3-like dinuclear metal center hexameric protein [Halocola ammonii]
MLLREITKALNEIAPLALQESYDNAGLITGDPRMEINGAVLCLDSTEKVIDEAISKGVNLVIAHHPIVFAGLKSLTGKNYIERTIIKAIKNDIAIYAAHTNLDNVANGVNNKIADKLGLEERRILAPMGGSLRKLAVFVPNDHVQAVQDAIFEAGGGAIGDYSECSFNLKGTGTFKPGNGTDPFVGEKGQRHQEQETKVEVEFDRWKQSAIISAMKKAHPYEEVAYDIYEMKNSNPQVGAGMVGELKEPMEFSSFLKYLKNSMGVSVIRHTHPVSETIKKVAVCGGSGSFLLPAAVGAGADIFITGDFKYHQFFDADGKIVIADIGHYESEQFTIELFGDLLKEKFPTFALHFTDVNTNPINYF